MDADEYTALGGRLDMAQIDGWYGRFEDIEIDPHRGEQPLYPIILSLE